MALTDAQVQALVAEPNWLRYREEDSITQISGTPTVVTRLLMRQLVVTGKAEDLDAVKVYLGTVKEYTAPQVGKGRAQAGTWTNGGHFVSKEQADENDKRTWNLVQILYQGSNSTLTYAVEKSCAYLVEAIKYFGLAEPPTLPAAGITGGYAISYEMVSQAQDQQTNSWTVVVLKRTRLEQSITYTSESAASYTETTAVQLGTVSGASTLTPGDGQYLTQQITKNPDCSNNKVLATKTGVKIAPGDATWTDANGASILTPFVNMTWAEFNTALTAIDPAKRATVGLDVNSLLKGRYTGSIRQDPVNESAAYGDAFTSTAIEYEATSRAGVRTYIGIRWTTSKTTASNWITATPTTFNAYAYTTIRLDVDGIKTFPNPLGRGRFMAVRVWQ